MLRLNLLFKTIFIYQIFFLILTVTVNAQTSSRFFIGHNLTASTEAPKKSTWSVGNYALAYSLSDHFMVATSPWIMTSYNSYNFHLKWTKPVSDSETIGVFFSYFESINNSPFMNVQKITTNSTSTNTTEEKSYFKLNRYQWKSVSTNLLYGIQSSGTESSYFNFKYSYYLNDDYPFSLRMDPGREGIRDQIDVSGLFKWDRPKENFSWAFEIGVLGLNYVSPFLHTGLSVMFYDQNWSMQIGASFSAMFNELMSAEAYKVGRLDERAHYYKQNNEYYTYRYYQSAVHPEIQIQYNF